MDVLYVDETEGILKTKDEDNCIECLSCEAFCPQQAIVVWPFAPPALTHASSQDTQTHA